jgi:hypothetical protein
VIRVLRQQGYSPCTRYIIGIGPLKKPIPNITLIFYISCLKTTVTNNLLLISDVKLTIINIVYCYQPILIIDPKYYNKLFLLLPPKNGTRSTTYCLRMLDRWYASPDPHVNDRLVPETNPALEERRLPRLVPETNPALEERRLPLVEHLLQMPLDLATSLSTLVVLLYTGIHALNNCRASASTILFPARCIRSHPIRTSC